MGGFKMRSGNKPEFKQMGSPAKHTLPGGERHAHDDGKGGRSFDIDTPEKDWTDTDRATYAPGKKKKKIKISLRRKKKDDVAGYYDPGYDGTSEKKKKKRKKDTIFRDTNRDGTVVSRAAKKIFTRRKKGRRIKTRNLVSGGVNITNPWTGRTN